MCRVMISPAECPGKEFCPGRIRLYPADRPLQRTPDYGLPGPSCMGRVQETDKPVRHLAGVRHHTSRHINSNEISPISYIVFVQFHANRYIIDT